MGSKCKWSALAAVLALTLVSCGTMRSAGETVSSGMSGMGLWVSDAITGDGKVELSELPEIEASTALQLVRKKKLTDGLGRDYPRIYPAHLGDLLLVADTKRTSISAMTPDGDRVWRTTIGERITGGIGVGEGSVLIGTSEAKVFALEISTGEIRWQSRVSSEVLAPPASSSGVVVVHTVDGKLFGLNLSDGSQKWMIEREVPVLTLRGTATPAAREGVAVSGFANGHLVAVDLQSGIELWDQVAAYPKGRTELDRMVDADGRVIIADNIVYSTTFQGRLVAVGLESGATLWSRNLSSYLEVALSDYDVYVTDAEDQIWALDRKSGRTRWKQDKLKGRQLTAPVYFGSHVVVADREGYIHLLSTDRGLLVGRIQVDDEPVTVTPWVAEGLLHVLNDDGRLMRFSTGGEVEKSGDGSFFSLPKIGMPVLFGGDGEGEPGVKPQE